MNLLRYEGYKLFHQKNYVCMVFILLFLQVALILCSTFQTQDSFVRYYSDAITYLQNDKIDVTSLSQELTRVESYLSYETTSHIEDPTLITSYQSYLHRYPELELRHQFLKELLTYGLQTNNYQGYVSDKLEKLQDIQYLPMWKLYSESKKDTLVHSIEAYQQQGNIAISPTNFIPFEQYLKQPFTFFLMISFVLITCTSLFQEEDTSGMMCLIRVVPKGRRSLIPTKLLLCIFLSCCFFFLLELISFTFYALLYGTLDLHAPIQAFPSLIDTTSNHSIGQWLLVTFFIQLTIYLLFGFLYTILYQWFQQKLVSISLFLSFLCLEFFLYQLIPEVSHLFFLKKYNLFAILDTSSWLYVPSYLAIGSNTITYGTMYAILSTSLLIGLVLSNCYRYLHPMSIHLPHLSSTTWLQKRCYHSSLHLVHEGIKLFWMNKGILVFIVVIGYSLFYSNTITQSFTPFFRLQQQALLKEYQAYGGVMTPEKWNSMDEEYDRIQTLTQEYNEIKDQYINHQIDQIAYEKIASQYQLELSHFNAFNILYEQSEKGSAYLLYPNGYQAVFAIQNTHREYRNTFFLSAMLILLLSGIYTIDQQHSEDTLYQLTIQGNTIRRKKKATLVIVVSISLVVLIYGIEFLSFLFLYPMTQWNASFSTILTDAQSLPIPLQTTMPLYAYAIIVVLLRLSGTAITSIFITWLSRRYHHRTSVILVSSLVLLFPLLLSMIGIQEVLQFSLFDIISGTLFLQQQTSFLKLFVYVILAILMLMDIDKRTKDM